MKIEPCPYCQRDVSFDLGTLSVHCPACFYTGPDDDEGAAKHNRLSRIVRAAEAWNKARRRLSASLNSEVEGENTAAAAEYLITKDALRKAVEGGAE